LIFKFFCHSQDELADVLKLAFIGNFCTSHETCLQSAAPQTTTISQQSSTPVVPISQVCRGYEDPHGIPMGMSMGGYGDRNSVPTAALLFHAVSEIWCDERMCGYSQQTSRHHGNVSWRDQKLQIVHLQP